MEKLVRFDSVKQYNTHEGVETLHPLVSVVRFNEKPKLLKLKAYFNVYAVFLKLEKCGELTYGCQPYDYDDGTLVFIGPGQAYSVDGGSEPVVSKGYGLIFHSDLLKGTHLGKTIRNYSFFSYEANEALHLSKRERSSIVEGFKKIAEEIRLNMDNHSKTLIVSNIELLLNYCMRYYDRQFLTRSTMHKDILVRFEKLLADYFASGEVQEKGLPTVNWCAAQLHLSANYFGDLIKKETGITALEYIQSRIIDEAKTRIFDQQKSFQELADELGFKYQQHFTRLFKQETGLTPRQYRELN